MRGQRIAYSADEMAWLEANRAMIISDYHRAFAEAFGRPDVSLLNLHSLRKRKGWFVGRGKGRFAGRHRKYSTEEMAWLEANRLLPISDYHAAFVAAFDRAEDVTAELLHALRKRMGWKTGRTGQFAPGQEPPNKGKPCAPGKGGRHPNARRTQFKRGQEPHNTKHLGHERVTVDGYVEISVAETNPHTGYGRRYVLKHVHIWQAANGPIPKDHCLKCIGDDRTNTDPSNWELIPRAILPRLNGGARKQHLAYDEASPEVRPALIAIATVEHRARIVRRRARA
jgi:hypothetical protein